MKIKIKIQKCPHCGRTFAQGDTEAGEEYYCDRCFRRVFRIWDRISSRVCMSDPASGLCLEVPEACKCGGRMVKGPVSGCPYCRSPL